MTKNVYSENFEDHFGRQNMSPNNHGVRHIVLYRQNRPLTETSTVTFESHYSLEKKFICPRSQSSTKMALQNCYAYYESSKEGHKCHYDMKFEVEKTKKTKRDNSLIALTNSKFGRIKSIEGNILKGKLIKTKQFWIELEEECSWDKIGVFLFDGESENEFTIAKRDVFGKALSFFIIVV